MKLNELVAQYVAFRKSLGCDFESVESLLKTFCRRMGEDIDLADVSAERVQAFLVGTTTLSGYWRRKYDVLHGLYRYAVSRGFADRTPLPAIAPRTPRFVPYIYPEDELRRLLNCIPACLNPPRKLEPHTLRAILLLLYGAGLRVGEAVALTVADVDVPAAVITIRNTKFHNYAAFVAMPIKPGLDHDDACKEPAGGSFSGRPDRHSFNGYRPLRNVTSLLSGRYRTGLPSCGPTRARIFSFISRLASRYIWVVWSDSWPIHRAMLNGSTPACSNSMAAVCLSTCGVTRFFRSEGHPLAAWAVYFFRRRCTASGLRWPPRILGNSASLLGMRGSFIQAFRIAAVCLLKGVTRCFRPLPTTSMCAPVPRVTSSRVRPVISDTRSPVSTPSRSKA